MSIIRVPEFVAGQTIRFRKLDAIIKRWIELLNGNLTNGNIKAATKLSGNVEPQNPDPEVVYSAISDIYHQTYMAAFGGPKNGNIGQTAPVPVYSPADPSFQVLRPGRLTRVDILVWGKDYTDGGANLHNWSGDAIIQLYDDQSGLVFDVTIDTWEELDPGRVLAPTGEGWKLYKATYLPNPAENVSYGYIFAVNLPYTNPAVDSLGYCVTANVTIEEVAQTASAGT